MNFFGHTTLSSFAAGCSAAGLYFSGYVNILETTFFCLGFAFATFMLGPDLDLYHSRVNKNWGVFRWIWWPYAFISKHRGLSHWPVVSSVTRLLYLCICGAVLLSVLAYTADLLSLNLSIIAVDFNHVKKITGSLLSDYSNLAVSLLIGIIISDLLHMLADLLASTKKKLIG